MKQINYFLIAFMMLVLSACASVTTPETPRQVVAASYITVESIADTAYLAHRDGVIDDEQRDNIREQLQESLVYITLAEQSIKMGDNPQVQLEAAQTILVNLQTLLSQRIKANE